MLASILYNYGRFSSGFKSTLKLGAYLEKCITDMTEIKASDGKLYVSAIFDCYDLAVLGLAMDTNGEGTIELSIWALE